MKIGELSKFMKGVLVTFLAVGGICLLPNMVAEANIWGNGEGKEPEIIFFTYGNDSETYTDGGWWIDNTARYTENEDGSVSVHFEYPSELYVALERMNEGGVWESVAEGFHSKGAMVEWINGLGTYVSEIGPWCFDKPGIYRYAMTYEKEDGTRTEKEYSDVLDLSGVTNKVSLPEIKISDGGRIAWTSEEDQGAVYRTYTIMYNTYGGQRNFYDKYNSTDKYLDSVSSFYLLYPDDWGEIPDYWSISEEGWELDLKKMLSGNDYEGYNFAFILEAASGNLEKAVNSSEIETMICFTRDLELVEDDGSQKQEPERTPEKESENTVQRWEPTTKEDIFRFSRKGLNLKASADSHAVVLVGEVQGPLFFEAINNVYGEYTIASTYNLLIDSVSNYTPEKIAVTFELPGDTCQEGREVVLIGVKEDGTPIIVKDLDQDTSTYTFVPTDAYAYALCVR